MFSRRIAPAHCTSGSDSIGRQLRFSLISRSTWAGTRNPGAAVSVCAAAGGFTSGLWVAAADSRSALVLGVVGFDLVVETAGHDLCLIHGGVVLLRQNLVELRGLRGLLVRWYARVDLCDLIVVLALQAVGVLLDEVVVGPHGLHAG